MHNRPGRDYCDRYNSKGSFESSAGPELEEREEHDERCSDTHDIHKLLALQYRP